MRRLFWAFVAVTLLTQYCGLTRGFWLHAETPTWQATAYCKGTHVAVGIPVKRGMAASDPSVLPLGSIVRVSNTGKSRFDGIYNVLDTGPAVKGQHLDLYMWSCYEALDFGRRRVEVDVLRKGWAPNEEVTR